MELITTIFTTRSFMFNIHQANGLTIWLLKWCKIQYLNSEKFYIQWIFFIQWYFYIQSILIFRDLFVFRGFFIFRDIFIFSEISVCAKDFLKNSCFKNVKKLLSRTAMLESFWGTLAGFSENLFAPAFRKRNSTVSAIFQNFKNLQHWRLQFVGL